MFNISICYDESIVHEDVPYAVGIVCINRGKKIGCSLDNQTIKDYITPFVTNMLFQHFGLSWIFQSNKNLSFDFQQNCPSCIINDP